MNMPGPVRRYPILLILLLLIADLTASEDRGTAAEAQALGANAILLYDEAGRDAAFAAVADPAGDFVNRDLYAFVYAPDRRIIAHGGDPTLHGTLADSIIDIDSVPLGARIMDEATESSVWVAYKWYDRGSREMLPKTSWIVRHDGYIFGVGVYTTGEALTPGVRKMASRVAMH